MNDNVIALPRATSVNPELQKTMHQAVTVAVEAPQKITGYALVSFHEGGAFRVYCQPPAGVELIDLPNMIEKRMTAIIQRNLKPIE